MQYPTLKHIVIPEGRKRPRLWYLQDRFAIGREHIMFVRPSLSESVPDGTSMKLWGLSSLSLRRWKRMEVQDPQGLGERVTALLSTAWEDSDRFTAIVDTRDVITDAGPRRVKGLAVRSYTYRHGIGGTASGFERAQMQERLGVGLSEDLGFIPNGSMATLRLVVEEHECSYGMLSTVGRFAVQVPFLSSPTKIMVRHGVHLDGGARQPNAPATITLHML